jgi:hypothetical protein
MRRLRIGIIDLLTKSSRSGSWARIMNANFASIMPQVIGTWCEQEGHEVHLVCFTGREDLSAEIADDTDLVFISAFTESAQLSYALSNRLRSRGAVTAVGGPHARCYPQDAQKYFDYVLGFTDRPVIRDVLRDCAPHRPLGQYLTAPRQPEVLPGVRERWRFVEQTLRKAPLVKIVPMIGSMGCPYACRFCIDAQVPYQPLDFQVIREDLQFLRTKFKRPRVGWHDPNFGVRFDDCMQTIESSVPQDSIDFIAESTLSILTEPHLKRLQRNGFRAALPGIESWFELGAKSKTGRMQGEEKLQAVVEHVQTILRYIPYLQANFVFGLDSDEGSAPFELTERFIDQAPAAFPAYSLLSAFGQAAPLNLQYQREGRVLPVPFHFLNNNQAMNVKPKNYSWPEFYDQVIRVSQHSFSWSAIARRFRATTAPIPQWLNLIRAVSTEGFGRLRFYREVRRRLDEDRSFRDYFEQETTELPPFLLQIMKSDLGDLWEWLPRGAVHHEPNAYLHATETDTVRPPKHRAPEHPQAVGRCG